MLPASIYYHDNRHVTKLDRGDLFVFGSNYRGAHGKGAALTAKQHFGAVYGCGQGAMGQCYAIATKDENLKPLSLEEIEEEIMVFIEYVSARHFLVYYITPFGTGLSNYSDEQIVSLLKDKYGPWVHSCVWPLKWLQLLNVADLASPYWVDDKRNPEVDSSLPRKS